MADSNKIDFNKAMTENMVIHQNVRQDVIVTTRDKLKLCLLEHSAHRESVWAFVAPLGILLAIITALVTSDFRDFFFTKETWFYSFLVASGVVGCWLVFSLRSAASLMWARYCWWGKDWTEVIIEELKRMQLKSEAVTDGSTKPIA